MDEEKQDHGEVDRLCSTASRPLLRRFLCSLQEIEQSLNKLLLKTAQSSLNVIKPSRPVKARKTNKIRPNRGEAVGADFPRGGI